MAEANHRSALKSEESSEASESINSLLKYIIYARYGQVIFKFIIMSEDIRSLKLSISDEVLPHVLRELVEQEHATQVAAGDIGNFTVESVQSGCMTLNSVLLELGPEPQ